jgi:hypothetical protein
MYPDLEELENIDYNTMLFFITLKDVGFQSMIFVSMVSLEPVFRRTYGARIK